MKENAITTAIDINAPIEKVWAVWNNPADIKYWNNTDENWENLKVENDLRPGGRFLYAMARKDGSEKFDFEGTYDEVIDRQLIRYTLNDKRTARITFTGDNPVTLTETFDPEPGLPLAMQKDFCHAVHVSFKNYVEGK